MTLSPRMDEPEESEVESSSAVQGAEGGEKPFRLAPGWDDAFIDAYITTPRDFEELRQDIFTKVLDQQKMVRLVIS